MLFYPINSTSAEIKIQRSLFIAALAPATTPEQAKDFIAEISKQHYRATHNCWAYICGDDGSLSHYSDNGEPSGTAGRPIFNALAQNNLTNTACVVTRYFGGIKLGVRGLIDAYGQAAIEAIQQLKLKKLTRLVAWSFVCSYSMLETLRYQVNQLGGQLQEQDFAANVTVKVLFELELEPQAQEFLDETWAAGKLLSNPSK